MYGNTAHGRTNRHTVHSLISTSETRSSVSQTINIHGITLSSLRVGDCIELAPQLTETAQYRKSGFFKIYQIRLVSGSCTLQGITFQRSKILRHVPNTQTNEVTATLHECVDDTQFNLQNPQSSELENISFDQVFRKRDLVITSDPFPEHRDHPNSHVDPSTYGKLFCRYVKGGNDKGGFIRLVRPEESTNTNGNHTRPHPDMGMFKDSVFAKHQAGELSYGSGFCGAGGDLLGAQLATFKPEFGFDICPHSCRTIEQNIPECQVYQLDQFYMSRTSSHDFGVPPARHLVCLHLSCPCQPFSPAHTCPGNNDEANRALSLVVGEQLKRFKPLFLTMEQTSGILRNDDNYKPYLYAILSSITQQRYAVRWQVFNLGHDFKLAASRPRLIIFASQEGVPLPPFPAPTHGPGRHFSRHFIWDALHDLPANALQHLEMQSYYLNGRTSRQYNPRTEQARCTTTDGNDFGHWSGLRPFTPRELARLQTFPDWYEFDGTKTMIKKQIGNAVPPMVWKVFMESIMNTIEKWVTYQINDYGQSLLDGDATVGTLSIANIIDLDALVSSGNPMDLDEDEGNDVGTGSASNPIGIN